MGTVVQEVSEYGVICRRVFCGDSAGAAGGLEDEAAKQWAMLDTSPLYALPGETARKYA